VPGVVCDPVRNDMFTAVRDGGSTLNGRLRAGISFLAIE
jgi:fructose-1,6-bisphosphatase/inositol monophosphatase family enzyme